MAAITSLPMSQTKEGLRRHLNMPDEIYTLMAKETDRVYKQLTGDKRHLKTNCKTSPPYDWNDVVEKSKDDAIRQLASNGSSRTAPYWQMAEESDSSPNWIAKWFLYHKFRYRDGRNKSKNSSGHKARRSSANQGSSSQDQSIDQDTSYLDNGIQGMRSFGYGSQQEPYYSDYSNCTAATTSSSPFSTSYGDIMYATNRTLDDRSCAGPGMPLASSSYTQSDTSTTNDDSGQLGKRVFDPVKDDWVHK